MDKKEKREKNRYKKQRNMFISIICILSILIFCLVGMNLYYNEENNEVLDNTESEEVLENNDASGLILYPWELEEKNPAEYTWDEYEMLDEEAKVVFENTFLSQDDFEFWETISKGVENPIVVTYPWDKESRLPSDYTLEEYEQLSEDEKLAFINTFLSEEDFNAWKIKAEDTEDIDVIIYPWDMDSKIPSEYTLEEYERLSEEEKLAFQQSFLSYQDFEVWMEIAQRVDSSDIVLYPWDIDGRRTDEYKWVEYEALSEDEKKAFVETFLSENDFEQWKVASQSAGQ